MKDNKYGAAAKTADLILIMLDATKSEEQRRLLEIELDAVGIRLNKRKPDVVFKRRTTGGVSSQFVSPVSCHILIIIADNCTLKLHSCAIQTSNGLFS